jgi:hypothetical protein
VVDEWDRRDRSVGTEVEYSDENRTHPAERIQRNKSILIGKFHSESAKTIVEDNTLPHVETPA